MPATYPNLTVAQIPGYRPLHLDLHVPAGQVAQGQGPSDQGTGDGPWPVVFWVHGGGWRSGSRLWLPESIAPFGLHDRLLRRGYAVADVDYRLSAEAPFPAQLDDVWAAIAWIRGHAAEFGLDPGRFAALGESAGAHLAMLAGLRGEGDTALQAVVDWYGPADLLDFRWLAGSPEAQLLGAQPRDLPAAAAEASPVRHVRAGAPPFLCVHGTDDAVVPLAQSEKFVAALRAQGVRGDLVPVPGADHCFVGADDIGAVIDLSIDFLDDVFGRSRPAS